MFECGSLVPGAAISPGQCMCKESIPWRGWYVIRPSCLVQPLYGSVAIPVTNSWPLRCMTSKKVKQESDWNGPKMMDGIIAWCLMTIVLIQLASGLLSWPMKSNYMWIINVFVLDLRWYLLVWSAVGVCQEPTCFIVFIYLGCLHIITGFIFILLFIFTSERLQPFIFFPWEWACKCLCVGTCATEQRQFWRGILEMDGLPKIF